jgi:hypothetical protein
MLQIQVQLFMPVDKISTDPVNVARYAHEGDTVIAAKQKMELRTLWSQS